MPSQYRYLLTRLRIEQTRLLNWGEHIGLMEISLGASSVKLGLNHNIINDLLLEIQAAFRGCVNIQADYSSFAKNSDPIAHSVSERNVHKNSARKAFLERVLAIPDASSRATARLQWAMVRKDKFESLIDKLIALNDRIESILDRDALGEIRAMQAQSNLMLLQVTDEVTQLRTLVDALTITRHLQHGEALNTLSPHYLVSAGTESESAVAGLARFKAEAALVDIDIAYQSSDYIELAEISLERSISRIQGSSYGKLRSFGHYRQSQVWLEWREQVEEARPSPKIQEQVERRVEQLTALLCSKVKPPLFRSPTCLGYVRDHRDEIPRYALVYELESPLRSNAAKIRTLREALTSHQMPSLGDRLALACAIAESVFYLHTVSWLHKDITSDNIIFVQSHSMEDSGNYKQVPEITSPILSGFDYSRPDLVDERSFRYNTVVANQLYRHPDLLQLKTRRSQKSHDLYSLGVVLVEVALWQTIEAIVGIEVRQSQVLEIGRKLSTLDEKDNPLRQRLAAQVGDGFVGVISRCIAGGKSMGISSGSEETDPEMRTHMQQEFWDYVVKVLQSYQHCLSSP